MKKRDYFLSIKGDKVKVIQGMGMRMLAFGYGETVWSPDEMLTYVRSDPREREIIRGLKGLRQMPSR